jgi:hypothetical protein
MRIGSRCNRTEVLGRLQINEMPVGTTTMMYGPLSLADDYPKRYNVPVMPDSPQELEVNVLFALPPGYLAD